MTDWIKGTIVHIEHWTNNLFSLQIAADSEHSAAGQYTWLGLDINGQRVADPYSILSPPGQATREFFLYTRLEGELSMALGKLHPGDAVWMARRAEGNFTLSRVASAETLWLLATGTGVAPFLSMLNTAEPWQRFARIVLVYAVRRMQDLCYREVIGQLQRQYGSQLDFIPFVSREQLAACQSGHITTRIADESLAAVARRSMSAQDSQVMLCGNPGMVRDVVGLLQQRGFCDNDDQRSGQLTYESYW